MAVGVSIRLAEPQDAQLFPAIEAAAGEAFRAYPDLAWVADEKPEPPSTYAPRIAAREVWVAEENGVIAGFLSAEQRKRDLHVWSLQVRPDFQKRGIGRLLLEATIAHARDDRLDALTLTTFRDIAFNERFYASVGFERIGDLSGEPVLAATIDHEVAQGLPREMRCAMRLALRES